MNTHIDSRFVPDTLVVGGGIAGLQSALDLADQGLKVLVVERQSSIGGHMIALSKVFPTLDCASCITTPKMSAAAHHENITILTNTEVVAIESVDGSHRVQLLQKPTYVNFDKCIGCRLCEYACDTEYPDPFEEGLGTVRAIAVPFTNAIPQKAVLDAEHCGTCGTCARVCPTDAIEFDQQPRSLTIRTDAVIVASGFQLNAMTLKPQYSAPMAAFFGRRTARFQPPLPLCSARARAINPSACPTARAFAACTQSSRPCCCLARFPWPTSPSTTWTFAPSAKATSSFTRTPKPWASVLCAAKWRASSR
jgi:ferredoxin